MTPPQFPFDLTRRSPMPGQTLEQVLLVRWRLPPIEAIRLLLPIAGALELLHSRGVTHRAVEPANIFCTGDALGRVQSELVDAGLGEAQLPRFGAARTTPGYLSPEQLRGDSGVDQRSDIWSFSVVLYEVLTGSSPFSRNTLPRTLRAILDDPPLPFPDAGVYDEELAAIVLRGLEKSTFARWQDMRAYGSALSAWLVRQGIEDDSTGQSLRVNWLGQTPSAPPVAIEQVPENEHFPGADDAYRVPKNGAFRTARGVAAAALTLAGVVAAGALALGAFSKKSEPASASDVDPWTVEESELPLESPPAGVHPSDDEMISGHEPPDGGEPDVGIAEAGSSDSPSTPDSRRPTAVRRWTGALPWAPAANASTDLPLPEAPPDLGPADEPFVDDEAGLGRDQTETEGQPSDDRE